MPSQLIIRMTKFEIMRKGIQKQIFFLLRFWGLLCAGALAALIFPPFEKSVYGYVALITFLSYLFYKEKSAKVLFWQAYGFGFAFFTVGFVWINNALLIDNGALQSYIPLVVLAIGAFFGLFWALPALICGYGKNIYARMLIFASVFVLFEWIRSFIFTGFPWNLLGTALSFNSQLIQGAAYVGTYGLSLFLLIFCLGITLLVLALLKRKFYKGSLIFLAVGGLFFYAAAQRADGRCEHCAEMNDFIVRLVQPSIPQTFKWHPALAYKNFHQYIDLSKNGTSGKNLPLDAARLVVWGETATPYFLDRDGEHLDEIREAIPQNGFLVTGVLRIGYENGRQIPYNSLYVIDKNGAIKDYYDKSHLVPFGEFLPFRKYLPDFMRPVADIVGDLGKGEKYKNIQVDGLPLMGGAICYESIFPKEVVNPKNKPEILLVLANDGWYGVSAGPYQHLAATQMRAVEEGVTVIRSANTGISAVIDMNGVILATIALNEINIADVALPYPLSRQTLYGKYGNIIPLSLIFLLLLISLMLNKYQNEKQSV